MAKTIRKNNASSILAQDTISVDAKITILLTPIKITIMETNELLQKVEETKSLKKLAELVENEELEVNIEGLNLADAKEAVKKYIEELPAEDDDDDDDDNNEGDDDDDDDEGSDKKHRNDVKNKRTMADIIKEMKKDPNRDVDFIERRVKYLNSLRDVEGEYGEYAMGTLTLDAPIKGYVATVNPETGDTDYVLGDQELVNFIVPSLIHTLRDNPEFAALYNKVRDDDTLLYKILAGTTVKMAVEYVDANTDWINPLSRNRNQQVRQFDHDTVIVTIYDVKELGPDAELWSDLERIQSMGAVSPSVVLALLDRNKKKIKSRR